MITRGSGQPVLRSEALASITEVTHLLETDYWNTP